MPKWRRLWDWFRTPRLSPLTAGLAAVAGLLAWVLVPSPAARLVPVSAGTPVLERLAPLRTIRFMFEAPDASTVAVTGDFLEWRPEGIPLHRLPSGEWAGEIELPAGVHHYAFVVDGHEWVADPAASSRVDDGFGHENSLLVVPSAEPALIPSATS
jgi:Glycogen recognition site of AMP-activated protein kinase